MTVLIH